MKLTDYKDIADIIQAIVTSCALIIGGIWSYLLFVRKRQRYPRAKIEHAVTQRAINTEATLLNIDIVVSNTGDVLLELASGEIEVRQVLPPEASFQRMLTSGQPVSSRRVELVDWPSLAPFPRTENWRGRVIEIEPGESEQLQYTLLVPAVVKTIYIGSYFHNVTKRRKELGWEAQTFHDVSLDGKIGTNTVQSKSVDERDNTHEATST